MTSVSSNALQDSWMRAYKRFPIYLTDTAFTGEHNHYIETQPENEMTNQTYDQVLAECIENTRRIYGAMLTEEQIIAAAKAQTDAIMAARQDK
jgi:disulfide oxidoreductase YuzD